MLVIMMTLLLMLTGLLLKSPKMAWPWMMMNSAALTTYSMTKLYSPMNTPIYSSSALAMDPLNSPLVTLTLWILPLLMMASQAILTKKMNPKMFMTHIITLTMILTMLFYTSNMMMFYILFEFSLIPTFLIIMTWGYQPERLQASMYMLMYTVCASLPLLMNIMIMYNKLNSMTFYSNQTMFMDMPLSKEIWWATVITAFLVKMPLYLTHLWLPKAHVEAPVAGSMILAAILLKLGSYGLMRLSALFVSTNKLLTPHLAAISAWGALITSLICMRQTDMKALIAYSSVGHMGLLILGMMSNTSWGWSAALTMMIAHGLSSSAMFCLANMTYETSSTRSMALNKGMINTLPMMTLMWFLVSAANMAAPPTINLLSEIMLFTASMAASMTLMPWFMLASFTTTAYTLILYTATQHGQPMKSMNNALSPLTRNSTIIFMHLVPTYASIACPSLMSLN